MEDTPRLYDTLFQVLRQHEKWLDRRHAKNLAWMVAALIQTGTVSLTAWIPFIRSRAQYAQSTQRRFRRWLENDRIHVNQLYGPLITEALSEWGEQTLYLALDTSMLWSEYCMIRLAVIYRGRSLPLIWKVLEHGSSSVAFSEYQELLSAASKLLPVGCKVVFTADRGFADTKLMGFLSKKLRWQWRIRIKGSFMLHRRGHDSCRINRISLKSGEALFWRHVSVTAKRFGPVHLALARHSSNSERWSVLSSEPTDVTTFDEYGLRFDIEESFLDDKSNGFQLEASWIRSAEALGRLCFILAVATLFLVSQGTAVVEQGDRRFVDPHWFRGNSYFRIGWQWVKHALTKGWSLITTLHLSGEPDPEPCIASRTSALNQPPLRFTVSFVDFL